MTGRAMSAGTVETQSGSGRQPASAVANGDGPQITGDYSMTDISKSEPVPATNQAGEVAISKAIRITAYDRKDPLAIRLEFADDADRVSAADEIDLILSDAFAAARARMASSLAEARQTRDGRLIPVTRKRALATQPATSQEGELVRHWNDDRGVYEYITRAATPTPPTLSEDLLEALEAAGSALGMFILMIGEQHPGHGARIDAMLSDAQIQSALTAANAAKIALALAQVKAS